MQALETEDDLAEILCGEREGEDFFGLFGLQVHEVSAVAILEHHVEVVIVLQKLLELNDVLQAHLFHALHLSLQIFEEVLVLTHHFFLVYHFERPPRPARPLLHQKHIAERAFSQLSLADKPVQEDAVDRESLWIHQIIKIKIDLRFGS